MKILFDHQIFSWQYAGGISRYFMALFKNISVLDECIAENTTFISNNAYLSEERGKVAQLISGTYVPGKTQLIKYINRIYTSIKIRNGNYDIFHPTYYDDYFLNLIRAKPYVVTVYDMIHEILPKDFPDDSTPDKKKKVIKSASRIIAISKSTKRDVVKILGINPTKIDVVYLASSLNCNQEKEVGLPKKYILYVGDRSKYKNFNLALDAIKSIYDLHFDLELVCVGGGKFTDIEKNAMGKYLHRCHQYNLSDQEMVYAYKHALCLISPSLYEGFGLPVVEAMQCGCPVTCSNTSSYQEVGGQAVLYFDPKKSSEMIGAITRLIYDRSLRSNLIRRGYNQAKKFSWYKCAKETEQVYMKALEQ